MNKNQWTANLLLLNEAHQTGRSQLALLKELFTLGFKSFEVRREFFENISAEIPAIATWAATNQVTLFYSIPDELFINGELNPKLEQYLKESQQMGIKKVKFNIGDYSDFTGDAAATFAQLKKLRGQIELNVENDQTQVSGRIAPIVKFLQAAKANQADIGYVYDLGNWRYTGEDLIVAANELAEYVHYIHVKDVKEVDGQPVVRPLDAGSLPWREALDILPNNVPIALEYPTRSIDVIEAGIDKLNNYREDRE